METQSTNIRNVPPPVAEVPSSIFTAVFVQAFMALCLFWALIYQIRELALFCLLILFMGIITFLWGRAGLKQVQCRIDPDRSRLFPGEELSIQIRVVNQKLLPVLVKMNLPKPGADFESDKDPWIKGEAALGGYGRFYFSTRFSPQKRGVYNLGPPLLGAGDLFGFFSRAQTFAASSEVVVYPRIVPILPAKFPKKEFYGIPGARGPVEDPVYVYGTREYQPGRPSRHIHWKASARHGKMQEKLCETSEQEKILLLLDVDQFEKQKAYKEFETTLEVMASMALQLDRRKVAVGLATNGKMTGKSRRIIPISKDPSASILILEALARVTPEKTLSMTGLLSAGYAIPASSGGFYFILSHGKPTRNSEVFLRNRKLAVRFVSAIKPEIRGTGFHRVLWLDDFLPEKPIGM